MTMIKGARVRRGMTPLAVTAVLLTAGCGTQRGADVVAEGTSGATPTRVAATSAPTDFPCPGERPSPTPQRTDRAADPAAPGAPTDHYAENHGFDDPFPLYGQSRCDGLVAVTRAERALEPLRRRGDFDPQSIRAALIGLGYPAGAVESYQDGPTGVDFLITVNRSPLCVEGTMDRASVRADAFGGYPDHAACDRPAGGH